MTYEQALAYIHSVSWKGSRPGLERIRALMDRLGNVQNSLRFIHVAGTNGKGSTSAMLASVLTQAGYRTGLYTSPFIVRFNERMRIDGVDIDDAELADITAYVKPFAESMEDVPTEFELITAIAFVYFARHNCDYVVLECGMGGRLDSTNVLSRESTVLSIITGIALDHTAFLGDTPEKIAAEKAGIIKKGAPMVWGGHDPAARRVIADAAARAGVPFVAAEDTPMTVHTYGLDYTVCSWGRYKHLELALLGTYQPGNLATVLALFEVLATQGITVSEAAVRAGLRHVCWRGRFEKLCDNPLIISDGAHNPEGIAAAVSAIRQYFPEGKVLFLNAVMADKDYHGMIAALTPLADSVYTLTPDNPRALSAEALAAAWGEKGVRAYAFDTPHAAVSAAVDAARARNLPLFSLGSLYMYREVTEALESLGLFV